MAMNVDFEEYASGFRHDEVISFINNEVLSNGGGLDFYTTFRLQSWTEIEDRLQAILADPELPSTVKRACTWSALTLGVRVGARQREQLVCRVQQLQDRVKDLEGTSWALAPELHRLRKERDEMASQLHFTQTALQQALNERDVLHGRLLQVETLGNMTLMAHEIVPGPKPEQLEAMALPLNEGQQRNVEVMWMPGCPWTQVMQPLLPVPYPLLVYPPFPMAYPSLPLLPPPPVFMETEAAVISPKMPSLGNNPSGPWAAVGAQEEMTSLQNRRNYRQKEDFEIFQDTVPLGDNNSFSQEQGTEKPQGVVNLSDNKNHSQKNGAVGPQVMAPLGDSYSHNLEQHLEKPQGRVTKGDRNKSHRKKKDPKIPRGTVPLGGSQSQGGDPEKPQPVPLRGSRSLDVRQNRKKQRPQGHKFCQPKQKRASESQRRKASAPRDPPKNWDCPQCNTMNYSWRKACFRCRIVYVADEHGDLNPGQTH